MIHVIRPGDTAKPDPFTIAIVANPVLEAPWNSGAFIIDPVMSDPSAFNSSVSYIDDALFGNLPNQGEKLLANPAIGPKVRIVSLFVPGLPSVDANSLVAQDGVSNLLIARQAVFNAFLANFGQQADIVYAVSKSDSHARASAWHTSDDDTRPGMSFILDGVTLSHRHFCSIPGTIAIHTSNRSLTALHEFGHALSSYTNGKILDLYVDGQAAVNNKRGRPIPSNFNTYDGTAMNSDQNRDGLGYPANWQSYHCELIDPNFPAVMDNYLSAAGGAAERCRHDRITRQFLIDRLRAKIAR